MEDGTYGDYEKVTNKEKVSAAWKIIEEANWENMKAEMERPPDYRFGFSYENAQSEAKSASYSVWITVEKESLELSQDNVRYVHLNKEDSNKLFEAITGTALSEVR